MLSYLTFFAVIVGASGFHGPTCVKCNQARDDEATCNYQMGSPGTVECDPGEVCTTDVRCDGQQRLFFIKGCQKHPTEMDTRICNPEHTRCHYHCDTDMCNKYVPANVISALVCTPTPTPEPMGPWCTKCNQARDSEEKCNTQPGMDGNMVQCSPDQVCTTDVRCDGQGRLFFIKGCENKSGITKYDELICNPTDTRCHFHCTDGDFCNENAPPAVWESLVCYDAVYAHCAVISDPGGDETAIISGEIHFRQKSITSDIEIRMYIEGFDVDDENTKHGVHVHEFGDVLDGCHHAGGHYNPFNSPHGGPDDDKFNRHLGDLGNWEHDDAGVIYEARTDKLLKLTGEHSILGRSVMIHAGEDSLDASGDGKGNAGPPLGCCAITLSNGERFFGP